MPNRSIALLVPLMLVTAPVLAQSTVDGTTAGGATYRIVMPDLWNGDLVIWNHGLSMASPEPGPDVGPLVEVQLSEGFAVAASSFQQSGYAVFRTVKDVRALVKAFEARFGVPGRIILYGASLGGLVTAQLLEKGKLGNVVGGMIWCGAVAGSRNWDAAVDLRLSYDAVCSEVPGGAIPGAALGLPKDSDLTDQEIELAVDACTGVDRRSARRTDAQSDRLQQLLDNVGIHEDFLQTDMWYVTRAMADLVHDKGKLKGKIGAGNRGVRYPDPLIDAAIERVEPKSSSARRLAKNYTPTGKVGDARVVIMHTDKDDLVVVENVSHYRDRLAPEQIVAAVAVEKEPSHCGFSLAEGVAGWEALLSWLNGGDTPTAESIQTLCGVLDASGLIPGPCRIDPGYQIGNLDERIPPR